MADAGKGIFFLLIEDRKGDYLWIIVSEYIKWKKRIAD